MHPQHITYAKVFEKYPSGSLDDSQSVVMSATGQAVYRGQDFPVVYGGIEERINMDVLRKLLFCARKPVDVATLRLSVLAALSQVHEGPYVTCSDKREELQTMEHVQSSHSGSKLDDVTMPENPFCMRLQVEKAMFLILWALKQDLLEVADTPCKEEQ